MADKEERILITKCSGWCHALRVSCDPFDDDDGMYCDKSGKWERITEKDCAKCKNPVLTGLSRSEVIDKIAKALHSRSASISDMEKDWVKLDDSWRDSFCKYAEAALNAFLEDK